MEEKTGQRGWLFAGNPIVAWGLLALTIVSCRGSDEAGPKALVEVEEVTQELTYDVDAIDEAGEAIQSVSLPLDDLVTCVYEICDSRSKKTYTVENANNDNYDPTRIKAFKTRTCVGDALSSIAGSQSKTKIELIDESIGTLDASKCFPNSNVVPDRTVALDVHSVFDFEGRLAVKELAYYNYFLAIGVGVLGDIDFSGDLKPRWPSNADIYNMSVEVAGVGTLTGAEIMSWKYEELSSVIENTKRLQFETAEELVFENEKRASEGLRERAFVHLWGAWEVCDDGSFFDSQSGKCWEKCRMGESWDSSTGGCVSQGDSLVEEGLEASSFCSNQGKELPELSEFMALVRCQEGACSDAFIGACSQDSFCEKTIGANPGRFWASDGRGYSIVDLDTGTVTQASSTSTQSAQVKCVSRIYYEGISHDKLRKYFADFGGIKRRVKKAVELLAYYRIDPLLSDNELEQALLQKARQKNGYVSLGQLLSDWGTNEESLLEGRDYMLAHLRHFPREIENTGQSELEGWGNPPMRLPFAVLLNEVSNDLQDYAQGSASSTENVFGLGPMLLGLDKLFSEWKIEEQNASSEYAEYDEKILGYVNDAQETIRDIVGDRRIAFRYAQPDGNIGPRALKLELVNPMFELQGVPGSEGTGQVQDRIVMYPLSAEHELSAYDNMLCLHGKAECSEDLDQIIRIDSFGSALKLDGNDVVAPSKVQVCRINVSYENGTRVAEQECAPATAWDSFPWQETLETHARWLVEHRVGQSSSEILTGYEVVGMLDFTKGVELFGQWPLNGLVLDAGRRIMSFDIDDLSEASCAPIGGLGSKCYDKDWVPGIDNELIDPASGTNEASYLHYLNLAETAAAKAEDLRREIVGDSVAASQGAGVEEASIEQAVQAYLSSVSEICGDQVSERKFLGALEKARQVGGTDIDAFRQTLQVELQKTYGCRRTAGSLFDEDPDVFTDISGNILADVENVGPVHCAVERRCSEDKPLTVGAFGIFEDLEKKPSAVPRVSMIPKPSDYDLGLMPEQQILEDKFSNPLDRDLAGDFGGVSQVTGGIMNNFLVAPVPFGAMARTAKTMSGDLVGPYESLDCRKVGLPEGSLTEPEELFRPIYENFEGNSETYRQALIDKANRLICWAQQYKIYMKSVLASEPLYQLPTMFEKYGTSGDGGFGGDLNVEKELGSSYGEYYKKVQDIAVTLETLISSAHAYVTNYDKAILNALKMKAAVALVDGSQELKDIELLLNAQFQKEMTARDRARQCVEDVNQSLSMGKYSKETLLVGIRNLANNFENSQRDDLDELDDAKDFHTACVSVAPLEFGPYKEVICGFLTDEWRKGATNDVWSKHAWTKDGVGMELQYRCECDRHAKCSFAPKGYLKHYSVKMYEEKPNAPYCSVIWKKDDFPPISIQCRRDNRGCRIKRWWDVREGSGANATCGLMDDHCDGCTTVDICENNYWIRLDENYFAEMADKLYEQLAQYIIEQECERPSGCNIVKTSNNVIAYEIENEAECTGNLADGTEPIDDIEAQWDKEGRYAKLASKSEFLNEVTQELDFTERLIETGKALESSRRDIGAQLRHVAQLISELSVLENRQVEFFKKFVNDYKSATVSSVRNNLEWNERYDYRVKRYNEQLRRARIAAWVARRAIEFRLGIDLEREVTPSIYGDVPADWANEIYDTMKSKCGIKDDGDEENGSSSIAGCLTPEQRIDDYVQKLRDYVNSYGNTPGQNWWFHENEDLAVVSIRDHLLHEKVVCNEHITNLLGFSEEVNMTSEAARSVYGEEAASLAPGFWEKSHDEITIVEDAALAEGELASPGLGLPQEVAAGRPANEAGTYEANPRYYSADLLLAEPRTDAAPLEVSQTVNLNKIDELLGASVARDDDDAYEFSVYTRKAPMDDPLDCAGRGLTYFPALGRCGRPCVVDESTAPWGDCPNPMDGFERKVCMKAGQKGEGWGTEDSYMCDWCTADKACYYQDGEVVGLNIRRSGLSDDISERRVVSYPFWTRQKVDTVEDHKTSVRYDRIYSTSRYKPVADVINVGYKTVETRNKVENSENLLSPSWTLGAASVVGKTYSPEGVMAAQIVEMSDAQSYVSVSTDEPGLYGTPRTASVWLKAQGNERIEDVTLELSVQTGDDAVDTAKSIVTLEPNWQRYELTLPGVSRSSYSNETTRLKIYKKDYEIEIGGQLVEPTWEPGQRIAVWGAQIEDGSGATVYLAKGKNLIQNSDDFSSWSANSLLVNFDGDQINPTEHKGAYRLYDSNTLTEGFAEKAADIDSSLVGKSLTFSVFARSADGSEKQFSMGLKQAAPDGSYRDVYEPDLIVGAEWRRFYIVRTIVAGTSGAVMSIKAATPTAEIGGILVWGPQLEVGAVATGYQNTSLKNGDTKVWGFNIGVAGAQLAQVGTQPCDQYGDYLEEGETLFDECVNLYSNERGACCDALSFVADNLVGDETPAEFRNRCMTCDTNVNPGCLGATASCEPEAICEGTVSKDREYKGRCVQAGLEYVRNLYHVVHYSPVCEVENISDYDYPMPEELWVHPSEEVRTKQLLSEFNYVPAQRSRNGRGYYVYRFNMDVDSIERGSFGQFGVVSGDNFNYRLNTVAMNVSGINVIDCSKSESPMTCGANPWLEYDLKQMGEVYIRNHHQERNLRPFKIPTGRINSAKAWVSEQYIGYPVSGAHQAALSQMTYETLEGRPLQGMFELRIYDKPELEWLNIEDIQLVFGYRYWTRSE